MAAQIIAFLQQAQPRRDWSPQEIAEFYRVESALVQSGMRVETDRGLTDEGDPWFVFCRADTGEVFIHFARLDGEYLIDGAIFDVPSRGRDFPSLIRELISRHPLARNRATGGASNVFLHPAALLIALVGTAFFHTSQAKAAELGEHRPELKRFILPSMAVSSAASSGDVVLMDANQAAALISSAIAGLRQSSFNLGFDGSDPLAGLSAAASTRAGETLIVGPTPEALAPVATNWVTSPLTASSAEVRAVVFTIAILHDLAGQTAAAATSGAEALVPPPLSMPTTVETDSLAGPAPGGLGVAHPLLMVTLSANSLPDVQAVQLVESDSALSQINVLASPQVERLPAVLADLIGQGRHLDGTLHPTTLLPDVTALSPTLVSAPETITVQAAPIASAPAAPNTAVIDAAIQAFTAEVHQPTLLVSGNDVVLYDHQILAPLPAGFALDSVTFTLGDGSTISLVGTAQEIAGLHLAG